MKGVPESMFTLAACATIYALVRIAYHFFRRGLTYSTATEIGIACYLAIVARIVLLIVRESNSKWTTVGTHDEFLLHFVLLVLLFMPVCVTRRRFFGYRSYRLLAILAGFQSLLPLACYIWSGDQAKDYYAWAVLCSWIGGLALLVTGVGLLWGILFGLLGEGRIWTFLFSWKEDCALWEQGTWGFLVEGNIPLFDDAPYAEFVPCPGVEEYKRSRAETIGKIQDELFDESAADNEAWETLGLKPGASREEVKRAYRERLAEYHPDKVAHLGAELRKVAEEKTRQIIAAYEQLMEQPSE